MRTEVAVWDPLVRVVHWALVGSVATAWLTHEGPSWLHDGAGYLLLALVAVRLGWGLVGPAHARLTSFVRGPTATLAYAGRWLTGREERHLGHNPLGGWMILALLASTAVSGLTGWLYTTDRFWGVEWMEELHELSAALLLVLIALHVGGVLLASVRHRENLVRAMISGRKPAEPGGSSR